MLNYFIQLSQHFLEGYTVYTTDNVLPKREHIRDIVKAAGGKYIDKQPKKFDENTIVIAAVGKETQQVKEDDESEAEQLSKLGYIVYNTELILTGVLRQQLELDNFILIEPTQPKKGSSSTTGNKKSTTTTTKTKRR